MWRMAKKVRQRCSKASMFNVLTKIAILVKKIISKIFSLFEPKLQKLGISIEIIVVLNSDWYIENLFYQNILKLILNEEIMLVSTLKVSIKTCCNWGQAVNFINVKCANFLYKSLFKAKT